ncbi:AAA family ATPase [Kribbella sp. NPDC051718]|uniref:AAA family ATPase n=1 Tax=Kribbella sp. NPDC051718 TaxID=3155168 RepID=UPI003425C0DF
MRLALVGAHGAGKTTLANALQAQTGIGVVQLSPMRDPRPGHRKELADCSAAEICQLAVRRSWERVRGEAGADAFISDGSVLHEWAYVLARLPDDAAVLRGFAEGVAIDTWTTLGERYDLIVWVPVEFPLPADAPITTEFQALLESYLNSWVTASGVPILTVRGALAERVATVTYFLREAV